MSSAAARCSGQPNTHTSGRGQQRLDRCALLLHCQRAALSPLVSVVSCTPTRPSELHPVCGGSCMRAAAGAAGVGPEGPVPPPQRDGLHQDAEAAARRRARPRAVRARVRGARAAPAPRAAVAERERDGALLSCGHFFWGVATWGATCLCRLRVSVRGCGVFWAMRDCLATCAGCSSFSRVCWELSALEQHGQELPRH